MCVCVCVCARARVRVYACCIHTSTYSVYACADSLSTHKHRPTARKTDTPVLEGSISFIQARERGTCLAHWYAMRLLCVCVCVRAWSVECERKNTDIKCMFFGGEMFSSEKNSEKNKWMDAQNGCFVCQLGREPKKIVCQCKNDCLSM